MARFPLSLRTLRQFTSPSPPRAPIVPGLADSTPEHVITRRDLLKSTAVAFVGMSAVGQLASGGRISVTHRAGCVRAEVDGREVWVLDPSRFSGKPRVSLETTQSEWVVTLSGARYPGTPFPADGIWHLPRTGTDMRVSLELGGFSAVVSAVPWLLGLVPAEGRFGSVAKIDLGRGATLGLGRCWAKLSPDMSVHLDGRSAASLEVLGSTAVADDALIALVGEDEPSLMSVRVARRSAVTLFRGSRQWRISPTIAWSVGRLKWQKNAFDVVVIEGAETATGRVYCALSATGLQDVPVLRFRPESATGGSDESWISYAQPRYAVALRGAEEGSAIVADSSAEPTWLRAGPFGILVVPADGVPGFELRTTPGGGDLLAAGGAVVGITAPLEDAIPGVVSFPTPLMMQFGNLDLASRNEWPQITPRTISALSIPLNYGASVSVVRPVDMLALRFSFYNLSLSTASGVTTLVRTSTASPAQICVHFPSQSTREQVNNNTGMLRAFASDESRLAFEIPAVVADAGIPYTLSGLLSWGAASLAEGSRDLRLKPNLTANKPSTGFGDGLPPQTSIDAPYWLVLNPLTNHRDTVWWQHSTAYVWKEGRKELWNTRLRRWIDQGGVKSPADPQMRAVYTPSYNVTPNPPPWIPEPSSSQTNPIGTLNKDQRAQLVSNTKDVGIIGRGQPITAKQVILTSQGATLQAEGAWPGQGLAGWVHRTSLGRDAYVQTLGAGFLYPTGHRASLTQIVERISGPADYVDETSGVSYRSWATCLKVTVQVLHVQEPERTYTSRDCPFKRVKIAVCDAAGSTGKASVDAEVTDWAGAVHRVVLPVAFVAANPDGSALSAPTQAAFNDVKTNYGAAVTQVASARIAYADPTGGPKEGCTSFETVSMVLAATTDANLGTTPPPDGPAFHPTMVKARIRVPAIPTVGGQETVEVGYAPVYLNRGFDPAYNLGELMLLLLDSTGAPTVAPADLGGESGGGIATLGLQVTGISRKVGAVGGTPAEVASGTVSLVGAFGSDSATAPAVVDGATASSGASTAKLLGMWTFSGIMDFAMWLAESTAGPSMPKTLVHPLTIDGKMSMVTRIDWKYGWTSTGEVQGFKHTAIVTDAPKNPNEIVSGTVLYLRSALRVQLDGPVLNDGASIVVQNESVTMTSGKGQLKNSSFTGLEDIVVQGLVLKSAASGGTRYTLNADYTVGLNDQGNTTITAIPGLRVPTNGTVFADYSYIMPAIGFSVRGRIDEFGIRLPMIGIDFKYLEFSSLVGHASTLNMKISKVEFSGALAFIETLQEYLSIGGKGPKLELRVQPSGAIAIFTATLPNIAVGPFSLCNLAMRTALTVPFDGSPVLFDFGIGSKQKPFELSLCGWGGKGFFAIQLAAGSLSKLEVQFEFGAMMTVTFFSIATGSVSISGGIYFSKSGPRDMNLMAFLKVFGMLQVLCVSVSVLFMLALGYRETTTDGKLRKSLYGMAVVEVTIDLALWEKSFKFVLEREITGSDPTFGQVMPTQADWDTYCAAFAPAIVAAPFERSAL